MPFSDIQGQDAVTVALRRATLNDRLHHAYLFHGLEGVGKRLTARALSQLLLCTAPVSANDQLPDACGRCHACERVERAFDPRAQVAHPDLHFLEREGARAAQAEAMSGRGGGGGSVKKTISVDQVRQLQKKLSFSAYEGGRRVVYIEDVDLMQVQAANAFLKTLEEPGEGLYFILTARQPKAVLNTILSRCQQLRFAPLSSELIRALILRRAEGGGGELSLSVSAAQTLAQLSGGSMAEAQHWLSLESLGGDEQGGPWEERLRAALLSLIQTFDLTGGAPALLRAWEGIKAYDSPKKGAELKRLLHLLRAWYRDVLILKEAPSASAELLTYAQLAPEASARAQELSLERLHWRLQALQRAERDLFTRQGANRSLILNTLAMYLSGFDDSIQRPLYPPR